MNAPWRAVLQAERAELVLGRLRWCTLLAFLGAFGFVAQSLLTRDPGSLRRLEEAIAYMVASAGVGSLTVLPVARRRPSPLAVAYVLLLVAVMAQPFARTPADPELAAAQFIAVVVGVALLLPWGMGPQAMIGLATLGSYGWVLYRVHEPPDPAGVMLVLALAVVSVAAAGIIERYRERSFERAWQQEQLLSLARVLATQVERGDVIVTVLDHALRLVPAHGSSMALRVADRRVYRVERVTSTSGEDPAAYVGLEIPEDHALVRGILDRDLFVLPEDERDGPLAQVLRSHGQRHALYATLRYGGEAVGILNLVRRSDVPFTPGERLLVRGITDQAAIALHTAQLFDDLRRASQAKSEFVSTMSHELRTPLNVILGYAEMAQDRDLGEEKRQQCLPRIAAAGQELLTLIESTLEIGRIESGSDQPRLEPVPVGPWWQELHETCARMPRRDGVRLEWGVPPAGRTVVTDPRKLMIVVRNLVGNALKFTEQGWVRAELGADDEAVVLRVADSGIGIRPEDQGAVFEMFRQADGSDSRRYGGAGLGLHIVRRFVQQLGGRIDLRSVPGRGSVFTVRVPHAGGVSVARPAA